MASVLLVAVVALVVGALLGGLTVRGRHAAGLATARAELAAERRRAAEVEARLEGSFRRLSDEALDRAGASFLQLAGARLGEQSRQAGRELDARRLAVDHLVGPLRETLAKVEGQLHTLESAREGAYAGLREQVRGLAESQLHLRTETAALVTALRTPATRGRWGELQLRRVVEMAGMLPHCDFVEQPTLVAAPRSGEAEPARLRPDVVVRLPGGLSVAVDAKVPLAAYLEATEATDERVATERLARHARQLRAHVDALSDRTYWDALPASPEFVVLFVPGEPFLAAALQADPDLIEYAIARKVMLSSPTTLIALLKSVSYGWRQEALADNAREVGRVGAELYSRLATLAERVGKVGRSLDGAVRSYNEAVGTLESRVLVSARRLRDLQVADDEIPPPAQVERASRAVVAPELGPPVSLSAVRAAPDEPAGPVVACPGPVVA